MTSPTHPRTCLVVGAGLVGPVLAMFLQRAGIDVALYEGRPAPRDDIGAFMGIAPNGRDVLGTLGIREEIEALGLPSPRIAFLNHRGKQLGVNPQPVVTFKRGVLSRGLREAAERRGVAVHWGKRLVGVDQDTGRAVARFADGTTAEADVLVGADGIHSAVRAAVLPGAPRPEYTGQIGSGAYARIPGLESTGGTMYMTFCLNGFFGYQVADDGEIYWFENLYQKAAPSAAELAVDNAVWKARLQGLHTPDHHPVHEIITGTTADIVRYPVEEMPVLDRWYAGRVALVGDAAHATGPHSGQGGSMGFEDAIVLARCLRDVPGVEAAFAAYQRIRKERVDHVVHETRRTGNAKTPPGLLGRLVRDLVLPVFLRNGVDTFKDIHRHHIPWDGAVTPARG
jgi:2-polyprenyl-6-methoxyphenol hydroxylase-like FAD-dependent oxidoreductase